MIATLVAVSTGYLLSASAILLGTVLVLEILLRRAIARFHKTGEAP